MPPSVSTVDDKARRGPGPTTRLTGLQLVRTYQRAWMRPDLMAGLTVWAILVPQALAYAELAGMPAVTGLYTAFAALLLYPLFGTSRELNMGPESAVAILVVTILAPMAGGDVERYMALAAMLAIMVGVMCIVGAVLKLGVITRLLSRPVLAGYIFGSALLIVVSQLGDLLGIDVDSGDYATELGAIVRNLALANPWTLAIGALTIAIVVVSRRLSPRLPAYLIAIAAATILASVLSLEDKGVSVIGEIPEGLVAPSLPGVSLADVVALILPALGVALLVFADSVLTAKSLASMGDYEVDADQEFLGIGAANIGAGLFSGFPVNGSQSRSVVLFDAKGRSQIANVVAALLVLATLLWLTPLFANLPRAALAGVVLVAAFGLFDLPEMRRLYRYRRTDFHLAMATAVGVIVVGMLAGIVIAVVLSLFEVIRRTMHPRTAVLGEVPDTDAFRSVDTYAGARTVPGLIIYRFDAPLFFANADVFREQVLALVEASDPPAHGVLVDAESIFDLDTTGVAMLEDLVRDLDRQDVHIAFARVQLPVRDLMEVAGLTEQIGAERFYLEVDDGVEAFEKSGGA